MNEAELRELVRAGEGAKLEFKRDGLRPEQLAKEIVSFANMNGGRILLGVDDDGTVCGINRANMQEWLMDTVVGSFVSPPLIPDYEEVATANGNVAVVSIHMGTAKPYAVQRGDRQDYYLRYGNICRRAGREQMARLFESGGMVAVERLPIHGSSADDLDWRRMREYFQGILGEENVADWPEMLLHRDLLVAPNPDAAPCCSYAATALFALTPRRWLPQAGLRLLIFPGTDMDYNASVDEVLDLPFVGLGEQKPGKFIEQTLPDRALSYLQPHISEERLSGMTRLRYWDYPPEAIREVLVNAFAHRDWTRQADIRLIVYEDRLEITSPGALPNGMTVEKAKSGQQSPRNPNIVRILRDYRLMDDRGMGIRRKVIPLMREANRREPAFEAAEDYFKVVLPKAPPTDCRLSKRGRGGRIQPSPLCGTSA